MKKFIINVGEVAKLAIYTDIDSIAKKTIEHPESITKTIPASIEFCGEVNDIYDKNNYITILKFDKKIINVTKEKNAANLFSPENQFFFPDLIYLAIGMLANDLQKKGYYFVQSSVVKYDDDHSIMLIGDPNAGKTTMAYSLMKNNNYKLISNDNVLIHEEDGKINTICGTKAVQMRYGGIKLYFPEILPYVSVEDEDKGRSDWDIKLYIDDYLKAQNYGYADNSIVTDIYNITTFKSGDTFIRSRERIDKILLIYEHLTKQIRSTRYALTGFNYPLPSFEDENFLQARYDMAGRICDNTRIYDARGTVDELSKRLVKKL